MVYLSELNIDVQLETDNASVSGEQQRRKLLATVSVMSSYAHSGKVIRFLKPNERFPN